MQLKNPIESKVVMAWGAEVLSGDGGLKWS
jgi:hypothetical protein